MLINLKITLFSCFNFGGKSTCLQNESIKIRTTFHNNQRYKVLNYIVCNNRNLKTIMKVAGIKEKLELAILKSIIRKRESLLTPHRKTQ